MVLLSIQYLTLKLILMEAFNFRPGDDGDDPFFVVLFALGCIIIMLLFVCVIALAFKGTIYW